MGFSISIGKVKDPSMIERTYEDINKIMKSQPETFKVREERENGHFKRMIVEA